MKPLKVLNNTRYHEGDLQAVVDLFYQNNLDWRFRWGTSSNYPPNNTFPLVFSEATLNEGGYYMGSSHPPERTMVGRTSWKSPHRMRLLPVDKVVTNPVESLSQEADQGGFYTAPFTLTVQIYQILEQRFASNRYGRSGSDIAEFLKQAAHKDHRPYTIRYRFGPKPRASAASRELEFQHSSRIKIGAIAYRARQARGNLEKMAYEMAMLLKNTKDRTEGLPFDPAEMKSVLDALNASVLPTLNHHSKRI
jgi:hypothetical protein